MEQTGRVSYRETRWISTYELAVELGMHPGSLSRWVKSWSERDGVSVTSTGLRGAYRMPITYRLVGRGWKLTQDAQVRDVMLKILPLDPKPWLVVVGDVGYTCYDDAEAKQRVAGLIAEDGTGAIHEAIHVFHLGNYETKGT